LPSLIFASADFQPGNAAVVIIGDLKRDILQIVYQYESQYADEANGISKLKRTLGG